MITRRTALSGGLALLATPTLLTNRAFAAEAGRPLPIPPLMDVDGGAGNLLTARKGQQEVVDALIGLAIVARRPHALSGGPRLAPG